MIHINRNGRQSGPYTVEHINSMLANGQVLPTDMAWWEGSPSWVPVSQAPGVAVPSGTGSSGAGVYAPPQSSLVPDAAGGEVSAGTLQALRETRPWVLFLSILGMIGTGLMLLGGLGALFAAGMSGSSSRLSGASPIPVAGLAAFYLVIAVLYLYPIIKLNAYARAIGRLVQSRSVRDLEDALRQQKSFWKFVGIVTLVVIALYVLIIILFVGGFAAAASRY